MSPTSYQTAPPRVATHVLAKSLPCQKPWALNRTGHVCKPPRPRARGIAQIDPNPILPPWPLRSLPLRTAIVDIGTNSTRLLVADVDPQTSTVKELHRESQVTRLGDKVDAGGRLSDEAIG